MDCYYIRIGGCAGGVLAGKGARRLRGGQNEKPETDNDDIHGCTSRSGNFPGNTSVASFGERLELYGDTIIKSADPQHVMSSKNEPVMRRADRLLSKNEQSGQRPESNETRATYQEEQRRSKAGFPLTTTGE